MITRRFGPLAVALALLVPLGCGDDRGDDPQVASIDGAAGEGSDGSGEGGDEASDQDFQDAALAYARCMRENGVEGFPDPEFEEGGGMAIRLPDGVDQDDLDAAEEECRPIMDEAAPQGDPIDPERQAELQDQMVELAECMRARGHDMPDPEVDDRGRVSVGVDAGPGGGGRGGAPDEEFERDMDECHGEAGIEVPGARRGSAGGSVSDGGA